MMKAFQDRVDQELASARTKFPRPQNGFHEAYAVLLEEVEEFWDLVKSDACRSHVGRANIAAELVQIAAMAQRTYEDLLEKRRPAK